MMEITAIIIDGDKGEREHLQFLLGEYCSGLKVLATAANIYQAQACIVKFQPDLLFLETNVAGESGFDLLKHLPKNQFSVIFMSAYHHHAIKAIKHQALDYLLKPFDIGELKETVEKVHSTILKAGGILSASNQSPVEIVLTYRGQSIVKKVSDILYCEADSNYTIFHFPDDKIVTSKTLKEYEQLFEGVFIRIHSKYLINLRQIRQLVSTTDSIELKNGFSLPVSRRRKQQILKILN